MKFVHMQMALLALCIILCAALMWNGNPWYHWAWFIICGSFIFTLEPGK